MWKGPSWILAGFCVICATTFSDVLSHAAESPEGNKSSQALPDKKSSADLIEQLGQSREVIQPPGNIDPGIQKRPPDIPEKMPVIRPPGEPGGYPSVKLK